MTSLGLRPLALAHLGLAAALPGGEPEAYAIALAASRTRSDRATFVV